jgi:hypothetical protein
MKIIEKKELMELLRNLSIDDISGLKESEIFMILFSAYLAMKEE